MRTLYVYFNELSCAAPGLERDAIREHLVAAIYALHATVRLRSDATLQLPTPFRTIALGDAKLTLIQVLPASDDRMRLLFRYYDRSPCRPVIANEKEVIYDGHVAVGMSWAQAAMSFILSLGHAVPWSNVAIQAEEHSLDSDGLIQELPVTIRNLATAEHAVHWRQQIQDYGFDMANSSLIYRGNQFVIRMHFNDHDPAHVHIYNSSDNTDVVIAKIRIDNGDILDGELPPNICRIVLEVIKNNQVALMEGWTRCRINQAPIRLG